MSLAPDAGLIRLMLGHAMIETGDDGLLDQAIANIRSGLDEEPLASIGYRYLATALQRQGKTAEAELATAEGLFIDGDIGAAQDFARRAQAKFSYGAPGWLRADDIINYEDPRGVVGLSRRGAE